MHLTFSALYALAGKCGFLRESHGLGILEPARLLPLDIHGIVAVEGARDINALRTGHAIPAPGASHLLPGADLPLDNLDQFTVMLRKMPCLCFTRHPAVFAYHFHGIHTRKHAGHLRLIIQPAESKLRRRPSVSVLLDHSLCPGREKIHQLSAPERLHDDHRDPLLRRGLQPLRPCLGHIIQIIILDLAEIPVIIIQDPNEVLGISMVGKADIPDLARLLLLFDPAEDPNGLQLLPHGHIRQVMHQIVVHIVRTQPRQFFIEVSVDRFPA